MADNEKDDDELLSALLEGLDDEPYIGIAPSDHIEGDDEPKPIIVGVPWNLLTKSNRMSRRKNKST